MSNLIQYIIQDDPEEELKKKQSQTLLSRELSSRQDTDKNYKFNSRHLLENDFSHLQSKPAPTARSYLSQALAKNMAKEGNKVSSALSPQPIGNDAASYKIAQNNKGNVVNDANALQRSNLSDDELIEMMYPIMKDHENAKQFPYYDTRWNITVGVGNNINNKKDFYNTKWTSNGMPASKQDLDNCLENLKKEKLKIQQERIQTKQDPNEHNYVADYFAKFCNIKINENTMHEMYVNHAREDLKNLRLLISNFDKLSLNKKFVLMDYMYNLGARRFSEKKFPNFIKGARTDNVDLMLKHAHRLGIDDKRNNWTINTLKKDIPTNK